MNSITSLIPRPKPVRIAAIDTILLVSELTLNDLADLQAVLDSQWEDPLRAIDEELDAAQGDDRRRLLAAAYDRAEVGPPVYGEAEGNAYFTGSEGAAYLLWVACRRNYTGFTPEKAATIFGVMSSAEFSQVWRVAHGHLSLHAIERMLGSGTASRPTGKIAWGKLAEEVVQDHPGWTYADIYALTITEFFNARRRGREEMRGQRLPMDSAAIKAAIADQKRRFYGDGKKARV